MASWLSLALLLLTVGGAPAAQYFVDAATGSDDHSGSTPEQAFATIQRAADLVVAGDTVVVGPGVYFESVQIKATGTAEQPITFRADRVAPGRVIVTGANRAIRTGEARWTLEDATLGLYSTPYDGPQPSRVLYSHTDLYPYRSLEALRTFMSRPQDPGPRHGSFADLEGHKLYVRLHASGRYGSTSPAEHVMAVAPGTGEGARWFGIKPHETALFNFGLLPGVGQSSFVVLDGFTCETPGTAGVFVEGNDAVVRNCWFRGCRAAVAGRTPKQDGYVDSTNRVVVEHCDYTHYPAFQDAMELLGEVQAEPASRAGRSTWFFWSRKSGDHGVAVNYENGVAGWIGEDWTIRHCTIWDCFEALGAVGNRRSLRLRFHDNLVQGVVDNAIEFEDRSRELFCYRNEFVDVFQPLSWQPLKGPPWPGPIYVYENLFRSTPEFESRWEAAYEHASAVFKIGASLKQWANPEYAERLKDVSQEVIDVPAPGLLIYNNTVWCPRAKLFEVIGGYQQKLVAVQLANNILVSDIALPDTTPAAPPGGPYSYTYANNLVVCLGAGSGGQVGDNLVEPGRLGLADPAAGDFTLRPDSPAVGRSRPLPGAPTQLPNIGACQPGQQPFPDRPGPLVAGD